MWTRVPGAKLALTGEEKMISDFPVFVILDIPCMFAH